MRFFKWDIKIGKADNRVSPQVAAKQTDKDKGALPIVGGRSSQAESSGTFSAISGMSTVPRIIPKEYISSIEYLSLSNPDFSHAIDNICDLAATPHTIKFHASVSDDTARKAREHLDDRFKNWYLFGDGKNGLITDLLRQCCNAGCVSAEIVPMLNLKGVQKVVLVAPASIEFLYNEIKDEYMPHQRPKNMMVTQALVQTLGLIPLNPVTYKYFAMYRLNDNPYAIPPYIAALKNTTIGDDLLSNLQWVAKNMGIFGIVSLMAQQPALEPGENIWDESYQARCDKWLKEWRVEAEQGFKNGVIVGFKDNHDINISPAHVNATGAKDIWQMNDIQMVSGLKQDGVLLNRDQKTSEAFAKIAFKILVKRIASYQRNVAAFLSELYRMELQLAGFPINSLEVTFEQVDLTDKLNDTKADEVKINNVLKKRDAGIISQEQAAQELGYEKAYADMPDDDKGKDVPDDEDDPKPTKEKKKNKLNYAPFAFDYWSERTVQGIAFDETTPPKFDDPKMQSLYEQYTDRIKKKYRQVVQEALNQLEESLVTIGVTLTADELATKVIYHLYATFQEGFGSRIKNIIIDFVEKGYRRFRKDKSIFGNKAANINKVVDLALSDHRAMAYFQNSDQLYLGRFITDPDTRERITDFIKKTYLLDGEQISHNPDAVARFKTALGQNIINEDWKINRIIATTVNKMRNYAAVNYMREAQVAEFEIRGVNDSKQCVYCAGMQGKRFSVTQVAEKIDRIVEREPQFMQSDSPFITAVIKPQVDAQGNTISVTNVIKNMTSDDLFIKGIHAPPYHPHCRDVVLAVL